MREGGDTAKLRELIDAKLSVVNELKTSSKDDLASIVDLTNFMLENLRFEDGRALKECLEELRLKRKLQKYDQNEDE
jgi:3-phosphoglycerate kinase